jgi:predicted alpha/beta hydrolase
VVNPASVTIPATDGFQLAASLFTSEIEASTARTVVIAPATAVKRRFYEKFAAFLASQGLRALTFDYRGIGDSLRVNIRRQPGTMRDWGEKDLAGVLDYVKERYPESRLVVVGHSAGGQLVGLTDRNRSVCAMLTVAAQSGYWRHWPAPRRYVMAGVWYGLIPSLTGLFSYFPTKTLKMGENLPAGIALEWARWCRNERFFIDERGEPIPGHFDGLRIPIRAYSFEDDHFAPRRAVDALMSFYKDASIERLHLRPAEVSARQLGHFGFFRERLRDSLWKSSAQWLLAA